MHRSHFVQILNVPQRVRLASSLVAAWPAEWRVLARRGWAGEKDPFEHPAGVCSAGLSVI